MCNPRILRIWSGDADSSKLAELSRFLAVFHVPNLVVDASRCPAKLLHASNRRREKMTSPGLCSKASKSKSRGDQGSSVRKSAWIGDGDGVVEW